MRTWTKLAPAVLLALPWTLAPVRAVDPELTPTQKIQKDLDQLRQRVERIENDMTANGLRGARIEEDLREIRKLLNDLARPQERGDRDIRRYGPTDLGTASMATITVQNQYPATATIHLNGRAYVIQPYRTATISAPVGPYNYEVEVEGYGLIQSLQTETLAPVGRRITIFPR